MLGALLATLATALVLATASLMPRWHVPARYLGVAGVLAALVAALVTEGWEGPVLGAAVAWPEQLRWLGEPLFRSDALGAGLGAWCLLLGALIVARMASRREDLLPMSVAVLTVGCLYALAHTDHLLLFAAEVALLAGLVWASHSVSTHAPAAPPIHQDAGAQMLALGLGAAMMLGGAALVGRASGGEYSISALPLPALSVWPYLMFGGFVLLWLGLVPALGWSAGGGSAWGALTQALVLGVPAAALLLRLPSLISSQALASAVPQGWGSFTGALSWIGALSALAGAAGAVRAAGSPRFFASLAAFWLGAEIWALSLDTPLARYAGVAILLAWSASRVAWEWSDAALRRPGWGGLPRSGAALSLAAVPLTPGFAALWLLAGALGERGFPALGLAVAGAAVLAACGVALHVAHSGDRADRGEPYGEGVAVAIGVALAAAGVLPGLWLPLAGSVSALAGGNPGVTVGPEGITLARGGAYPALFLFAGAAVLVAIGWAAVRLSRRRVRRESNLLPTAIEPLERAAAMESRGLPARLLGNPPSPIGWLLLGPLSGTAGTLSRGWTGLLVRGGGLMARLEGRYYLPLALVLTLILLLAVTR